MGKKLTLIIKQYKNPNNDMHYKQDDCTMELIQELRGFGTQRVNNGYVEYLWTQYGIGHYPDQLNICIKAAEQTGYELHIRDYASSCFIFSNPEALRPETPINYEAIYEYEEERAQALLQGLYQDHNGTVDQPIDQPAALPPVPAFDNENMNPNSFWSFL
jgi:hypothetical protein